MEIFKGSKTVNQDTLGSYTQGFTGNIQEGSILPPVYSVADQSYGKKNDTIDATIGLRNLSTVAYTGDYNDLTNKPSSGGSFYIGNFTITGVGNKVITGVGFQPKLVKFTFGDGSGNNGNTGFGAMTSTSQHAINNTNSTQITSQCIYYGNPVIARAVYVSMDSDGFTINCTLLNSNTYVNYECYG